MPQDVFVDANVFYSKTVRDWLHFLHEANPDVVTLHSTEAVFAEVLESMRRNKPWTSEGALAKLEEHMHEMVDRVHPPATSDIPFTGSDPGDRHVHASSVEARVDTLLTFNKPTDFRARQEDAPYRVQHPDALLVALADRRPGAFCDIVREQHDWWAERDKETSRDTAIKDAQCPELAAKVREVLDSEKLVLTSTAEAAPERTPGRTPAQALGAALQARGAHPRPHRPPARASVTDARDQNVASEAFVAPPTKITFLDTMPQARGRLR